MVARGERAHLILAGRTLTLPPFAGHFADELRRLLESQPAVHLTRQTSITMAKVLRDHG